MQSSPARIYKPVRSPECGEAWHASTKVGLSPDSPHLYKPTCTERHVMKASDVHGESPMTGLKVWCNIYWFMNKNAPNKGKRLPPCIRSKLGNSCTLINNNVLFCFMRLGREDCFCTGNIALETRGFPCRWHGHGGDSFYGEEGLLEGHLMQRRINTHPTSNRAVSNHQQCSGSGSHFHHVMGGQ